MMKKIILTAFFCVCASLLILGSAYDAYEYQGDPSMQDIRKPLRLSRNRVYIENMPLSEDGVYNILSISPNLVELYKKGRNLVNTGTYLLIGGIPVFAGGVAVMVSGILTSPTYTMYNGTTIIDLNGRYFTGFVVTAIGELMIDGAIACKVVGKIQLRRSLGKYNEIIKSTGYTQGSVYYQAGLLDNGMFGVKVTF